MLGGSQKLIGSILPILIFMGRLVGWESYMQGHFLWTSLLKSRGTQSWELQVKLAKSLTFGDCIHPPYHQKGTPQTAIVETC